MKSFPLTDTEIELHKALKAGKSVLAEGAQGTMLDIDHGTYPFVSSSSTCSGGVCTGLGVAPNAIGEIFGIFKAYSTRVGSGPFPVELFDETGDKIREIGHEYGAVTGRNRRCGWLDLVVVNHANRLCGFNTLAITKLDVLNDYEEVKVCTAYEIDGKRTKYFPGSIKQLEKATPVYTTLKGWKGWDDTEAVVKAGYDALPKEMKDYIAFIEKETGVPADIISVGPDRDETISRRASYWA
jgi:adenylosuccinate synthase